MDFEKLLEWMKHNKGLVYGLIAGVLVFVVVGSIFIVKIGIDNTGNSKEVALNAQYLDNQNYLSDCVVRIRETAGVAKGETAAFDTVITNAVMGRYETGSTAQVGQGALFSAIVEAYPDLNTLGGTFDKLLVVINGCRTDYRGKQTQLLSLIKDYDTWRIGSLTNRLLAGGFPSENLQARVGEKVTTGSAALAQMNTIILVQDAENAYETGTLTPEDPFNTN
jgi:hypothetical protein